MKKHKLLVTFGAGVLAVALAACSSGGAETPPENSGDNGATETEVTFPAGDINMIVSYAAGGPTDTAGRAIGQFLEKDLGINVIVENKEGASGAVGTADMVRAEPDGYTIAMTTASAVGRVPVIDDVGYTMADVQPIGVATYGPGLVVVGKNSPYNTLEELIDAAKANPGDLKFATGGTSTPQHVDLVRMNDEYNVHLEPVPFQGDGPSVVAILGENVDGGFVSNAQTTMAQVDAGEIRVLAVGTPERIDDMPDVPTLAESGFENLVYGNSYFILAAPQGTPAEIIEILEDSLERALQDEATVEVIGSIRIPSPFMGTASLQDLLDSEAEVMEPILTEMFG